MGGESGAPLERVPTQKAQQSIASYNSALSRSNDGDVESTGVCPPGASGGNVAGEGQARRESEHSGSGLEAMEMFF